uniref:Predicted protein n=1 Tax=Hordeum vulgare subsp. vulgare TaxID=112509 RepID=F2DS95_HORVV|nr:predicted protein [Hordeum vulgare subsp. vulgare]
MVLEWIKANNFYFQITAGLLAKIRDIFILALIRMPFFDIYSTIKTTYIQKNYDDTVVYTKVSLNCHEMNRLQTGCFKYIYFSTFLIC